LTVSTGFITAVFSGALGRLRQRPLENIRLLDVGQGVERTDLRDAHGQHARPLGLEGPEVGRDGEAREEAVRGDGVVHPEARPRQELGGRQVGRPEDGRCLVRGLAGNGRDPGSGQHEHGSER
jgi:hypothetical protein